MMNYFLIRVPLSYLNAVEAMNYFNLNNEQNILVIFFRNINDINVLQINKMIDRSLWDKVICLPYNVDSINESKTKKRYNFIGINKIICIRRFVKIINESIDCKNTANRIFVGDYNIASMRFVVNKLKPKETILIDEGFQVLKVIKKSGNDSNCSKVKNILNLPLIKNNILNILFHYDMRPIQHNIFFTTWDLYGADPGVQLIKNNFFFYRNRLKDKKCHPVVFFLGQMFSEAKFMPFSTYFSFLKKTKEIYVDKRVCYIPHRGESEKNVEYIVKELDWNILRFDVPIEYQICVNGPIPEEIISFCSSALVNLNTILRGISKIKSIYIDQKFFIHKSYYIEEYYSYLEKLISSNFYLIKFNMK